MDAPICYALPCPKAPHGEFYVMCEQEKWPRIRVKVIRSHPDIFERYPIVECDKDPILYEEDCDARPE